MSKPLTVKELLKHCQDEIKKGHGDYTIMLSNDDEGNGYHYCWYSFVTPEELHDGLDCEFGCSCCEQINEDIAPKSKTILLG
jgi:hypothetical protein